MHLKTYALFELNEYIRRVLSLNMPDAIWVRCEIAQIGSAKGHRYIELIEKAAEGDEIIANAKAVLWQNSYRQLKRKLGKGLDEILQEGLAVLLLLKVDFHERYGFKLIIEDADPAYTIGQLSQKRQHTILQLRQQNLLDKNAQIELPVVLQRVAIISSVQAAGYADFIEQLGDNPYGYHFKMTLFSAAMQGIHAAKEINLQLQKIARQAKDFDCVAILRGGGSKIDLIAFDDLDLSKTVAKSPLPILTGIGHDIDETVLDLVAHRSLKTPTALADFIIHHNAQFESTLLEYGRMLEYFYTQKIKSELVELDQLEQSIQLIANHQIKNENRLLAYIQKEIPRLLKNNLTTENRQLDSWQKIVNLLSPEQTLQRGFSLTLLDGKVITDLKNIKKGDVIQTKFNKGSIESEVKKKKNG